MSDQLSSDLASLTIDRDARAAGGSPLRVLLWVCGIGAVGYAGYTAAMPYLQGQVLKTEVSITELGTYSPVQAAIELTSTGYVEPQRVSRVGAKIAGRIAKVYVRQGERVEQGAPLFELERADREAAIQAAKMRSAAAQARVATSRANLAEARMQAERERGLAERGVSPAARAQDLEARVASLTEAMRAAEAEVKAADAEVAALKVNLEYMRVDAPITGTVVNKPPELGELVGLDLGAAASKDDEKVIELADFSTLMVETDIPESRLHMVQLGSPCDIALDAFPTRRYRGEAVEINPRVDRAKATVGVKVKFVDAPEGVLPDMSARVSFLSKPLDREQLAQKPKTIVPSSALIDREGQKVLFVVQEDIVRLQSVTVGEPLAGGFELIEGPAPGTRVVSEPPATLTDGQRIKEKS